MTKIEDMSEPERQSWITLLAEGSVFIYFWQKLTQGYGFKAQHFEPAELGEIFLKLIIITVVLHAVIGSIFEMRKRKEAYKKDERDVEISRLGDRNGYWLMQAGIGTIMVTLLIQYLAGDNYIGPLSVIKPVEMIFSLWVVSYIADLFKHGTMVLAYRR